ncbi:transglycosylase domain-containing protein (plasmid) [Pontibacillus sp. ALD_SL1]|uniref:transglycosylase domain-containing protein n=1 Tax=Pontibacillus sp. ALD_SL1 TaxID=2777185 RepID=UPI001A97B3AD|nr:transglycosylase domain-containing protein [Pontibacillus sp. ALD_SL1]QST02359.1 transglycosylase domain-containing protein [Pontibacillus sp. ALD_SL1]
MKYIRSFIKAFVFSFIITGILTGLIGGAVYYRVAGYEVDTEKLLIEPKPTVIYDQNGKVLASFLKERKDATHYADIPTEILDAIVATEDRSFYDHAGINVKAIARAAITNFQSDSFSQGGSTITQQLVKNIYLTPKKSIARKMEEAVIASQIEKELEKNEILSYYLNHIFYGHRSYGIKSAVLTYFGETLEEFKESDRIDRITKAALLGGLPQLPSTYSPYSNPEQSLSRRNDVLHNMLVSGFITKEEYEQAVKKPFLILEKPNDVHEDEYIHYGEIVDYTLREAAIKSGISEGPIAEVTAEEIEKAKYSGFTIFTSFDPAAYALIREQFDRDELFPASGSDGTPAEGAVSVVNPTNGEIIAFTGGRDIPRFTEFNRAYDSYRQPGSSFKPIIAYGPAIESGKFHPWSVLMDNQGHDFGGGYRVKNFGGTQQGRITMIDAITRSQNVPAVYLLDQTGINYAKDFAKRLGIYFSEEDTRLPIALGGLDEGVNTLMMADAYQAFANGGYRVEAHIIKRMVNHEREVVHEVNEELDQTNRVMKTNTFQQMRFMLNNVVKSGTGTNARIPDTFVAGKTGTTEYPGHPGLNKDIWFSGFTNSFTMSVWMGFDHTSPERNLRVTSYVAAKMWGEIGKELVKLYPPKEVTVDYEKPEEIKPEIKDMKLKGSLVQQPLSSTLSWDKEEDTVYKVFRDGDYLVKLEDETSFADADIQKGKTYTYKVIGYNRYTLFQTYQSNVVTIKTPEPPKPPRPNVTVGGTTTSAVVLSFNAGDADSYIVKRNGEIIYQGNEPGYKDTGLTGDQEVIYDVYTVRGEVMSEGAQVVVKTLPNEEAQSQETEPAEENTDENETTEEPETELEEGSEIEGNPDNKS